MTNHPNRSTFARLAGHKWVEHADDERNCGNGVFITLKQGWTWEARIDNRVRGFDSVSEALRGVQQNAEAFAGPYTT